MKKILFVCHGNICRSPMAEFIFKELLEQNNLSTKFLVNSGATSTEEIWNGVGNPVYPPAREELKKHNISCEGKRAVQIKISDYNFYDYIIVMDEFNLKNVHNIFGGDKEHKISKLLTFCGEKRDVDDPWYTRDFKKCYDDILRGCNGLLKFLENN